MLKQRIVTALVALSVLAIVLFVLPQMFARAVVVVLFIAAAWEWAGFLFASAARNQKIAYVLFVGGIIGALQLNLPSISLVDTVLKVAMVWWAVALIWLFVFPTQISRAIAWLCGALVMVPAWIAIDYLYQIAPDLLVFLLLIVWVADIGAYFVGRGFGRVKLAPEISPGKTWEGVLGGLGAVILLTMAAAGFIGIELRILVPFCIAVAMLSIVGDLTVSMFKRNAGVKDSGSLFPGHGGLLDRIDSVTAAAPLYTLGLAWLGTN